MSLILFLYTRNTCLYIQIKTGFIWYKHQFRFSTDKNKGWFFILLESTKAKSHSLRVLYLLARKLSISKVKHCTSAKHCFGRIIKCLWWMLLVVPSIYLAFLFSSSSQWGLILSPGDNWQCLETVLVVITGECCWYLLNTGQGCCWTSNNAPPPWQQKIIQPQIPIVLILRNCVIQK